MGLFGSKNKKNKGYVNEQKESVFEYFKNTRELNRELSKEQNTKKTTLEILIAAGITCLVAIYAFLEQKWVEGTVFAIVFVACACMYLKMLLVAKKETENKTEIETKTEPDSTGVVLIETPEFDEKGAVEEYVQED